MSGVRKSRGNGDRARGRGGGGSLLFVIQSHPDSKLFEVLSREIGFDHVDLMNCAERGRGSAILLLTSIPLLVSCLIAY